MRITALVVLVGQFLIVGAFVPALDVGLENVPLREPCRHSKSAGSGRCSFELRSRMHEDDGRDQLPFEIYVMNPPRRRKIGTVKLEPSTACGDTIFHDQHHYKIIRVSNHYKWRGGRFIVFKKTLETKELQRVAIENIVTRMYGSGPSAEQEE
ncbi:unnamed protein product [Discosporangium mesarthrocarpum]